MPDQEDRAPEDYQEFLEASDVQFSRCSRSGRWTLEIDTRPPQASGEKFRSLLTPPAVARCYGQISRYLDPPRYGSPVSGSLHARSVTTFPNPETWAKFRYETAKYRYLSGVSVNPVPGSTGKRQCS